VVFRKRCRCICLLSHDANDGKIAGNLARDHLLAAVGRDDVNGESVVASHGKPVLPYYDLLAVQSEDGAQSDQIGGSVVDAAEGVDDLLVLDSFGLDLEGQPPVGEPGNIKGNGHEL